MSDKKNNIVFIVICALTVAIILAGVISLCVYDGYAKGVSRNDIEVYFDGNLYEGKVEVEANSTHEVTIKAKKGIDYYICVDSAYGYVEDNKILHVNDGLKGVTSIPVRVMLVKQNYAVTEYDYYLLVLPI